MVLHSRQQAIRGHAFLNALKSLQRQAALCIYNRKKKGRLTVKMQCFNYFSLHRAVKNVAFIGNWIKDSVQSVITFIITNNYFAN